MGGWRGGGQTEKGERGVGGGVRQTEKGERKGDLFMCRRQETETRAQLLCNVQLVSAL